MNDLMPYIASYFEGSMKPEERVLFEERCVSDPEFAGEVAAYIVMRDALKQALAGQKRNEFAGLYEEMKGSEQLKNADRSRPYYLLKNFIWYAAAACIGLIATWLIFFRSPEPEDLAQEYVVANFSTLSTTMGGVAADKEDMQQGIAAFNARQYKKALQVFQVLSTDSSTRPEAVKNLGITYLVTGDYSNAILKFDVLAKMDLYVNPGVFYKALVLMKRGRDGDRVMAKKYLKQVADQDLAGSREAKIWLEKL
jgi:tetratricopeptide (TPR) repeat protein